MSDQTQNVPPKRIFYFEDDLLSLRDYYEELRKEYDVVFGAGKYLVEMKRTEKFDLVIIDIMIHTRGICVEGLDDESIPAVENLSYAGYDWTQVGIEFLRQIREGNYSESGFNKDVPVIVVSARFDSNGKEIMKNLGYSDYLVKPNTIEELMEAVQKVFSGSIR